MIIIGKKVKHKIYGEGTVSNQYENKMEIDFGTIKKLFLFPDAFEGYITIQDEDFREYVTEKIKINYKQKAEKAKEAKAIIYRNSLKQKTSSHAVFNLSEDELRNFMDTWELETPNTKTKAKVINKLNMNSACIITTKDKNKKECERMVVGLFMMEEDYLGGQTINAHEKYRAICNFDEDIYFWSLFPEDKRLKNWKGNSMKYVSTNIVKTLLQSIINRTYDEDNKKLLEELQEYFCEMNQL